MYGPPAIRRSKSAVAYEVWRKSRISIIERLLYSGSCRCAFFHIAKYCAVLQIFPYFSPLMSSLLPQPVDFPPPDTPSCRVSPRVTASSPPHLRHFIRTLYNAQASLVNDKSLVPRRASFFALTSRWQPIGLYSGKTLFHSSGTVTLFS